MTRLIMAFVLLFALLNCTNHNEDDYFKDNPDLCYTNDVSFTETVFPLIESSCISCHNSNSASGGINLSNYEAIKSAAQSGSFLGSIKHDEGYSPMPQFGSKLPDCTILQIEAWIEQGSKNN